MYKFLIAFALLGLVVADELKCTGENEELHHTTNVCPINCQNRNMVHCLGLINKPSCGCKAGNMRDMISGKCVAIEKCPAALDPHHHENITCGQHEQHVKVTEMCPLTCQNKGKLRCLGLLIKDSCHCAKGYIREEVSKKCVAETECPKIAQSVEEPKLTCGENEHYSKTTPMCPSTCQTRGMLHCLGLLLKESCQCNKGFLLDKETKKCVPETNCAMHNPFVGGKTHYTDEEKAKIRASCDPVTEMYSETVSACPAHCTHGVHTPMTCMAIIHKPSCVCRSGLLRDTATHKCISFSECKTHF